MEAPPTDPRHVLDVKTLELLVCPLTKSRLILSSDRTELISVEARLAFPTDAGFHRATVFGSGRAEIEGLLSRQLGERVRLTEEKSEAAFTAAPRSVAETEADAKSTRERGIEARVRANPAVLSVLRMLGGSLEHVQILEPAAPVERDAPVAPDDDA